MTLNDWINTYGEDLPQDAIKDLRREVIDLRREVKPNRPLLMDNGGSMPLSQSPLEAPPNSPQTMEDFLWVVRQYEKGIFVREMVGAKMESVPLASLSPKRWAYHVNRFIENGINPAYVKDYLESGG